MAIPFIGALLRAGAGAALKQGYKKTAKNIMRFSNHPIKTTTKVASKGYDKAVKAAPHIKQAGQDIFHVAKVGGGQVGRSVKATKTYKAVGPGIKKGGKWIKENPIKSSAGLATGAFYGGRSRGKKKARRRQRLNK